MKTKKPNYYKEILETLKELKALYPSTGMGKHLSTVMDESGDFWGISDQELSAALIQYKAQMELIDVPRETSDEELETIIEDALHLTLEKEDFEGQEY